MTRELMNQLTELGLREHIGSLEADCLAKDKEIERLQKSVARHHGFCRQIVTLHEKPYKFDGISQEEHLANARLIAAAPELLVDARVIRDGFVSDPGTSDLDDEQVIYVRMTLGQYRATLHHISKAEGK